MSTRRALKRGYSLPELLAVLAIFGLLAATSVPALAEISAEFGIRSASTEVAFLFGKARTLAAQTGSEVGVKWIAAGGDITFALYQDGNGNGVRNADIRSGVDRLVAGPFSMKGKHPGITFSFVREFSGGDPSGDPIGNLKDPVRFGNSDICSFSPIGHASPGSVYLSNGTTRQACVRVSPATGKIRVYDWRGKKWIRE